MLSVMRIFATFAPWIERLRSQASSFHPQARVTGIVDFYNPELAEIGERVSFPRTPGWRDDDYAFHLGVHISGILNEHDELLDRVVNYKQNRECPEP